MDNITLDDIKVDELDDAVEDSLTQNMLIKFNNLSTVNDKLQFIINVIKNGYIPLFDDSTKLINIIDELNIMISDSDENYELTSDIVDNCIEMSLFIRDDDHITDGMKERLLILLTYILELVGKNE